MSNIFKFSIVIYFLFIGKTRAEVVISNLNSSSSTINVESFGTSRTVSFAASSAGNYQIFTLKVYGGSSGTLTSLSASFNNGSSRNSIAVSNAVESRFFFVDFDISDLAFAVGSNSFQFQVTGFGGSASEVQWARTGATSPSNGGFSYLSGFSNASSSIDVSTPTPLWGQYAVSVPEPGTLFLSSLAAASGGWGVWWKRRRKKVLATRGSGEAV